MINRYMKHVAKPVVKTKEPLLKKVADNMLIGLAIGLVFNTVAQAGYDVATKNEIVDVNYGFGSVIFSHNDKRTTEQLFQDIENRINEVEGLEQALLDGGALTRAQQEELIKEIIRVIADEASISTNGYSLKEMVGRSGYYFTLKNPFFSISGNDIILNEALFGLVNFRETVYVTIHEMIHAVEDQNRYKGKTVSSFDKKVFYATNKPTDYHSSPNELNAFLISAKIMSNLEKKFGVRFNYFETLEGYVLPKMFSEIMYNLYGVNTFENHDLSFMPFQYSVLVSNDANDYSLLTLDELIIKGFEKKLDNRGVKYSGVDLRKTYYYESFTSVISSIDENLLDVRYVDYLQKTYDVQINNVEEDITAFEVAIESATSEHNKNILIANKLAKYSNVFRYQIEGYTDEEKDLLSEQVLKYIGQVSSQNVKTFGLQDVEEKLLERVSYRQGLFTNTKDVEYEV